MMYEHSSEQEMGLHLNFELHLDATVIESEVAQRLLELHEHARSLPVAYVSDIVTAHAATLTDVKSTAHSLAMWAEIVASVRAELEPEAPRADPDTAVGFFVHPGRGSETASFALMRCNAAVGRDAGWYWQCHCKTQYASIVSDEHLVACHTALVSLLDRAIEIGFGVEVCDETRYWQSRDTSVLLDEVHAMNRIVAGLAGRMSDAISETHRVAAPIFEHPRFERLEMQDDG
jgi:hypothetical protein